MDRLKAVLKQKQTMVVKKWFEAAINTYPSETAQFLNREADPFANPVGQTLLSSLKDLFEALLNDSQEDTLKALLDPIVRIRAVQDFSPGLSLAFLFSLKAVIRQNVGHELKEAALGNALFAFESQIDQMGLIAFDIYMKCREKIYELKANQIKDRTVRLLKKADLLSELPEFGPVIAESKI